MKYTLDFIKVIYQITLVFAVTFITPAILHALATLDHNNYFVDIKSIEYQVITSILSVIVTFIYIVAYTMHKEELANAKL